MNKEKLIRNLEHTKERHKDDILNTFDTDISMMCSDVLKVLENCIEIPKEATNGTMIETMFPNLRVEDNGVVIYVHYHVHYPNYIASGGCIYFDRDWWYSPFKKEGE